jgi:hypothetical protein
MYQQIGAVAGDNSLPESCIKKVAAEVLRR